MAHLHAILAAGAVLVKRGPRAQTRTIGWDRRTDAFDKPLGAGWALRQTHWCGSHLDTNRGLSWESFALVSASGAVERQPAWEWADVDPVRRRLVWTEDCVLHCAEVASAGLERARVLLDTRDMVFERLLAPY